MDLRDNATSIEEFSKYEKEIENISYKLHCIVVLDKQHRMTIPKSLFNELGWRVNEEVYYEGLGTSLLLTQNKNSR